MQCVAEGCQSKLDVVQLNRSGHDNEMDMVQLNRSGFGYAQMMVQTDFDDMVFGLGQTDFNTLLLNCPIVQMPD